MNIVCNIATIIFHVNGMTNENLKIEEHHIDMKTSNNVECIEDYLQIYKRIIREIKMTIMMKEQYINTNVIVNIIYKEVKKKTN